MIHFSSNFSTYPLMILPRQKKEAPLSLNNPSVSSYTLASFQTQLLLFYNSQYPFMPKLENWALKICIGLYSLFSSSLKPLKSDVFSLLLWCSVQSLSRVQLFVTSKTAARRASQSITNYQSSSKSMSIESAMLSNYLILCCPLLLLCSIFPSIRVFSNESALRNRWPKYWSFSFNISPSNEHPGLISLGWTGWISLQSKGLSRVFSNTTVQKHQFFCAQHSL